MNIEQELSIVRDNIAEYGMTNITQLEYDAIYQQGRADKEKELWELPNEYSEKLYKIAYNKGREDAFQEQKEFWDMQNHKAYEQGRADAIEKYNCKSDCEYDGTCEMCVRWDKLADCYKPPKDQNNG